MMFGHSIHNSAIPTQFETDVFYTLFKGHSPVKLTPFTGGWRNPFLDFSMLR
jgi:hypothetical protein